MAEEKARLKEFHKRLHDNLMAVAVLKTLVMEQKVTVLRRLHDHVLKNKEFTALDPDKVASSIQKLYIGWKSMVKYGNTFNDFLKVIDNDVERMMKDHHYTESSKLVNLEMIVDKFKNTIDEEERESVKREIIKRFGFT
jgi:hypothetical protein